MKQFEDNPAYVLVIQRGRELMSALKEHAQEHELTQAWLTSGLGGASSATISWYDLEAREYRDKTFDEMLEISSLSGNLSIVDGEPFWHIHGTMAGRDYAAIAGHIKFLTVGLTCELLITPIEIPMTRKYDDETGLKLLARV